MKSDLNSEVEKLFPNMEEYRSQLQASIDDILDQKVTKTDMKLRHIVSKGLEVSASNQTWNLFELPVFYHLTILMALLKMNIS